VAGTIWDKIAAAPRVLLTVLLLALVATLLWTMRADAAMNSMTAYFPRTVALYPGSEVRVLGVAIGQVESVTPVGDKVKVELAYEAQYAVPADAKAVIISPAVVGDRFVQLTPAYVSGPKLQDGAVLGTDRTATPVELDEIYQSLDDLSVALGPRGANKEGALNNLLESQAANLDGNGALMHRTIEDLGTFTGTLSNNKEELFGTLRQLDRFTTMLAENDKTIRAFNRDLAKVAGVLRGERRELSLALSNLSTALTAVSEFVHENRDGLRENVKGLRQLTQVLVNQRDSLVDVLDVAPLALNNLFLTYNPNTGTLDTRANIGENVRQLENDPGMVLCSIVAQADNPGDACSAIQDLLDTLPTLNRGAPFERKQIGPVEVERVDPTLAGLVPQEEGR
jgi:phospholipid/cholesterol/gamma-HCH transport system substrate-binding protein